jgi:hypothetical protein
MRASMAKKSWWQRRKEKKVVPTFAPDHVHSPYWCERHWAPYRGPNAQGIVPNGKMASQMITSVWMSSAEFMAIPDKSPQGIRASMEAAAKEGKPLCCRIGDEVMGNILEDAIKYGKEGTSDDSTNTPKVN